MIHVQYREDLCYSTGLKTSMKLSKNEAKKRWEALKETIEYHRDLYYAKDSPEISDEEYDALERELISIEEEFPEFSTPDSPTQKVGVAPSAGFKKIRHKVPQWSFNDVFNEEEAIAFNKRVKRALFDVFGEVDLEYTCELKIDGLKIVLEYQNGNLVTAATRGDGAVGEDVTENVKTISSIPHKISVKGEVIVEGEIYLPKKQFEKINSEIEKNGGHIYANPRNLAAGTLRQLDPEMVRQRNLDVFLYDIAKSEEETKTQYDELNWLREKGFKVDKNYFVAKSIDEVINFWKKWADKKGKQEFLIDGIVVKVNDKKYQRELGYTGKGPRYAMAFKFPAEQTTTVVEEIAFQVGRTGVITPVAHLKPVFIAGSKVSRATLHNEDEIKRLDVRVGDTVVLQKAGDIIPQVVKVVKELRPKNTKPFIFPEKIPECGGDGKIERIPGEAAYRCVDKNSYTVQLRKLAYFASKSAFDIAGLGPKQVEQLVDAGLVQTPADFFTLKVGDLLQLERFAEVSANKLVASIDSSREVSLERLIIGLSIDNVGEETAILLAQSFGNLEKIRNVTKEELQIVDGVGEVVAESIFNWFKEKIHTEMLEMLLKEIKVKEIEVSKNKNEKFFGKTFVLTGTLSNFGRDEAKDIIRKLGGSISSSVSKSTDYVVAGSDPGSKYEKALELGVQVLNEDQFSKMLK